MAETRAQAVARLSRELDAGRLDGEEARRTLAGDDAAMVLLVSLALGRAGRRDEARAAVRCALRLPSATVGLRVVAARIVHAMGDFSGAFAELESLAATPGTPRVAAAALDWKFDLGRRIGRYQEAFADSERAAAIDPGSSARLVEASELRFRTSDDEAALALVEKARRIEPGSASLAMRAAGSLVALRRWDEAAAAVEAAIRNAPASAPVRVQGAERLVEAGEFATAAVQLREALVLAPHDVDACVALGRLHAWAGELAEARSLVEGGLRLAPEHGPTRRLLGQLELARGAPAEALVELDRALVSDGQDFEAHVSRGEALLRLGRLDESLAALIRGEEASEDGSDYLAPNLLRLIVLAKLGRFPGLPESLIPEALDALCAPPRAQMEKDDAAAATVALEEALAALGGNRSYRPTRRGVAPAATGIAALVPLRLKPSPRVPSKRTLWLLAGRGKQAALDAIARVHERYADSPEPWCYHGEIHLYLGEYVEARRAFDTALSIYKRTRWAFIGLAAVELLEGRPDVAIATLRRGSEMAPGVGPTTYVYRGEALLRLGRLDEAIADLEHATRSSPSRVGAWIDLALARDQKGDGHAFAEVFERLRQQAPDLLAEAAREQGPSALHPPADRAAMRALFEHLLVMLRGNRSSTCVTWFTRAGALRVVPATFQLDENYVRRELGALRSIVEKHAGAVPPQREHREG